MTLEGKVEYVLLIGGEWYKLEEGQEPPDDTVCVFLVPEECENQEEIGALVDQIRSMSLVEFMDRVGR